jgi:hypothetical protein
VSRRKKKNLSGYLQGNRHPLFDDRRGDGLLFTLREEVFPLTQGKASSYTLRSYCQTKTKQGGGKIWNGKGARQKRTF